MSIEAKVNHKMNIKVFGTIALSSALLFAAGCKRQSTSSGEAGATAAYTSIDWNTAGTITGTVHFPHKSGPPPVEIDMAQDPACNTGPTNTSEGYMVRDGKLQNVFVYVKDGLGHQIYAAPSEPVVIDQKGCRYIPHVVGVMTGQPVEFTNSDPTMHNIHMTPTIAGNSSVDISQAPNSGNDRRVFHAPELMIPVRCNNHPWMQAFINVSSNPFFAVTDANGHFEIKGLPPGTYTVVADHEKLGQVSETVTVGAKQTVTQDFNYGNGNATPNP